MGISVSESAANRQIAEAKRRDKQANIDLIKRELSQPIPGSPSALALKQNLQEGRLKSTVKPLSTFSPQRSFSPSKPLAENKGSRGQKKMGPIDTKEAARLSDVRLGNQDIIYDERKEVEQFMSMFLGRDKLQKQTVDASTIAKTDEKQAQNGSLVGAQTHGRSLSQRPATTVQVKSTVENQEMPEVEFERFDWHIPSEKDVLAARHLEALPSMNLVLSNKFNEDVKCMDECRGADDNNNNRRQIMRQLLAGRRETAEQGLLPSCGEGVGGPRVPSCHMP